MKHLSKILAISLWFCSIAAFAQPYTFRCFLQQQVVGANLQIDIMAEKLSGPDFPFGSTNFVIEVTPTWLNVPFFAMDPSSVGPWDVTNDPAHYLSMSSMYRDSLLATTSFVITSSFGTANTTYVTSTPVKVARFLVPITDPSGYTTTRWRMESAGVTAWPNSNIKAFGQFQNPDPYFPLCSAPSQPIASFSGPSSVCLNQTTSLTTPYSGTHIWYENGVEMVGQAGNTIVAEAGSQYTVRNVAFSCVSELSAPISVGVLMPPTQPSIASSQTILATDATLPGLQWYLNGMPVQNANSGTFIPTESGVYTVSSTNACGSSMSEPVTWTLTSTSIADPLSAANFSVYPNPFQGQTSFHYTLAQPADVKLVIYDLTGRHILTVTEGEQQPKEYTYEFNPASLGVAQGTYMVHFTVNGQSQTLKLVEAR